MKKVLLAVAMVLAPASAHAAAFTNGSFEAASVNPGGGFLSLGAGDTSITGWTVGGSGVDYIGGYWQAAQGSSRSVDLSLLNNGSISQTFDTLAGVVYNVTFYLAGNPDGPPPIKTASVQASGNGVSSYTFDSTGKTKAAMGWALYSYIFTATGPSTILTFSGTDGNGNSAYGAALDAITVTAVPEPAAWAMMLMGFGFAGAALRRRRQPVRVSFA